MNILVVCLIFISFTASLEVVCGIDNGCPALCDPNNCPAPEGFCFVGFVKDKCNCCLICGRREGERCFNETFKELLYEGYTEYPPCGENLECRMRTDLAESDKPEAICYCTSTDPICGNDGVTYENECQFTEARYKNRNELFKVDDGRCESIPEIITPPEDITNNTGSSIAFSCEVKGWPIPQIEWQIERDGIVQPLPSDDCRITVLSREGPSKYEMTSWLQLVDAAREDSGNYFCVVSNSLGQTKASAYLTVGNFQKKFDQSE